jgi:hypothetical protein
LRSCVECADRTIDRNSRAPDAATGVIRVRGGCAHVPKAQ